MTDRDDDLPTIYRVRFSPEALEHLVLIEDYIGRQGSPLNAAAHVDAIVDSGVSLEHMPQRGTPRDDIRPGLRTTVHARTTLIAFEVDENLEVVTILGVLSTSLDWPRLLSD